MKQTEGEEDDAWRIFFLRTVLVTASRFRPLAKVGDEINEHPQNIHLTNIIESNMKLRLLQHGIDMSSFTREMRSNQIEASKSATKEKGKEKAIEVRVL